MADHHLDMGVIVARKKVNSPWADRTWLPHAVLPDVPAAEPWTRLGMAGEDELFYAGALQLTLHSSDTAHYRDNLTSGRPSIWVSLRILGDEGCSVSGVTADPYEGEALTEAIGVAVEAVPMPHEMQARIAAFCEAFHVERPFVKRERDRAVSDALGYRRSTRHTEDA